MKSCFFIGPNINALAPLLATKGWVSSGYENGEAGAAAFASAAPDVVAVEIDLDDGLARSFLLDNDVKSKSKVVLIEDAAKAHRIVAELAQGISHFLPLPVDQERLVDFFDALVASKQNAGDDALEQALIAAESNLQNIEADLARERARADALENEKADLEADRVVAGLEEDDARAKIAALELKVANQLEEISKLQGFEAETNEYEQPAPVHLESLSTQKNLGESSDAFAEVVNALWPSKAI